MNKEKESFLKEFYYAMGIAVMGFCLVVTEFIVKISLIELLLCSIIISNIMILYLICKVIWRKK